MAPFFMASITSSAGGWTARTTSASATNALRSAMKATSLKAESASLIASPAPVCMCSFAPSLMSLGTTDGARATRRSCGWVSFRTATLTYMKGSNSGPILWRQRQRCRLASDVEARRNSGRGEPLNASGAASGAYVDAAANLNSHRGFGGDVADQFLVHELLDAHVAEFAPVARSP